MTKRVQKTAIEVIAEIESPTQLKIYLSHPKNLANANNPSAEYYPRLSWALSLRVVLEPPQREGDKGTLVIYPTWGHNRNNRPFGPCGKVGVLTLIAGLGSSEFIGLGTYGFKLGEGAEKLTEGETPMELTHKKNATKEEMERVLTALTAAYMKELYPITASVSSFKLV